MGLALGCLLMLGCSGAKGGGGKTPGGSGSGNDGNGGSGGPTVTGTVGALDEAAVKKEVQAATEKAEACVKQARELLPYVEGDMTVSLRVDSMGKAFEAYLSNNDLGLDKTEACILDAFKARTWPKPVGGDIGEISQTLGFESGVPEPPKAWSEAELKTAMAEEAEEGEDPFGALTKKLGACRAQAGAGPMMATLYLDEDGLVQGVGTSVSDAKGAEASACVVREVQATSFPSPDAVAKVTVAVP